MNEKLPLLYDVVFPPDLIDNIKYKGKCNPKELAEKGMVLIFDSLLPKEQCTNEIFSQIPRMFCDEDGKTIIMNIDEYFKNVSEFVDFINTTGHVGEFPLWLFQNTFYLTELYSKRKVEELEKNEQPMGHNSIWAKYIQIQNEEAEKLNKEHWCIVVATHQYFITGNYLENLLEIHRQKWNKLHNGKNKTVKNGRTPFTKSIRHEVFKRDSYKCIECGASKDDRCLHVDHIIPVSRGGTDELDNLQTLCEGCNLAKKNRIINHVGQG
jgi:hypothetical protein